MIEIVIKKKRLREPEQALLPFQDPMVRRVGRGHMPYHRGGRLTVFIEESAHSKLIRHVLSDTDHEVGGVLLGYYAISKGGIQFLKITDVYPQPSKYYKRPTKLVFKTEFFKKLDAYTDNLRAIDSNILQLGLFHSHPGIGVFLSPTDVKTFKGIFKEPWQIAMVIDPLSRDAAVFYSEGKNISERRGYFVYACQSGMDEKAGAAEEDAKSAVEKEDPMAIFPPNSKECAEKNRESDDHQESGTN